MKKLKEIYPDIPNNINNEFWKYIKRWGDLVWKLENIKESYEYNKSSKYLIEEINKNQIQIENIENIICIEYNIPLTIDKNILKQYLKEIYDKLIRNINLYDQIDEIYTENLNNGYDPESNIMKKSRENYYHMYNNIMYNIVVMRDKMIKDLNEK